MDGDRSHRHIGAVSALYDKYLLTRYEPLEVQAWYSLYQMVIVGITIGLITARQRQRHQTAMAMDHPFLISPLSDRGRYTHFYSLSLDGSMIAVVSMIRRGSVMVSFFYGVIALHEKNIGLKIIDLYPPACRSTFLVIGKPLERF